MIVWAAVWKPKWPPGPASLGPDFGWRDTTLQARTPSPHRAGPRVGSRVVWSCPEPARGRHKPARFEMTRPVRAGFFVSVSRRPRPSIMANSSPASPVIARGVMMTMRSGSPSQCESRAPLREGGSSIRVRVPGRRRSRSPRVGTILSDSWHVWPKPRPSVRAGGRVPSWGG